MSDKPLRQFLQAQARSNSSKVEQWHSNTQLSIGRNRPILSCVLADYGPVSVREVGISFSLLSALLAGLLLQHTLHTSVCFESCNRSDPSVLVAKSCVVGLKYWRIPVLISETYSATFSIVILHKAHYRCFSLNNQVTFISSMSMCSPHLPKAIPTSLIITIFSLRCHQHPQICKSKVHTKHYSITVYNIMAGCMACSVV